MGVFFEKIVVGADVLQLKPFFRGDGVGIEIVDLGALCRKEKGRMGGDNELTSVKAGGILQKGHHFLLQLWRKAVFRLVKQIKGVFLYFLSEIHKRAFAVGFTCKLLGQSAGDVG